MYRVFTGAHVDSVFFADGAAQGKTCALKTRDVLRILWLVFALKYQTDALRSFSVLAQFTFVLFTGAAIQCILVFEFVRLRK